MNKRILVLVVILFLASCSPKAEPVQPPISPTPTSESLITSEPESVPSIDPTRPQYKTFSKLVFVSDRDGNNEIYSMEANLNNAIRMTDNSFPDEGPAWSNDGQKVVFHTERDGNAEIYSMDKYGGNQTNLSNNPYDDTYPDWSPDMQKIAFESIRDGNLEIYVMNADGSHQTRLTTNPELDGTPRWSPDGKKIAFSSIRGGKMDVYIMNPDGSGQTNLTNYPSDNSSPAWSPDGNQIAFDSNRDGQWELYIMNSDGTNHTRLTFNMGYYGFPDWSPDGQKIVFMCDNGSDYDICLLNVADGTFAALTGSPVFEFGPRWSPGSTELADAILGKATSAIVPTSIPTTALPTSPSIPAATPESPSACGGASGNWSTSADSGVSIIFTINDCKITAVMVIGIINGEWITVSTNLTEPITGSEYNFDYSFTDTDRFNFSGTFESPTSAAVQLIFYKGFRFSDTNTAGEDVIIKLTATL